jgi:5'-3' exoribonuclease 2
MGVPSFFRWLMSYNNNLIKSVCIKNVDYLMIDCNCLLHPCVAYINKKESNIYNRNIIEKLILNRITDYIDDIIEKTNPKHIFIAVDGCCPLSKIRQQRPRRYKSDIDTSNFKNQPIQTLELSVATPFMNRIHEHLLKYVKQNITYSSYHEYGEGEHKILQYIKKLENKNIVIYGLDADLIFLALTIQNNNVIIMREEQFINNIEIEYIQDITYNYVEIHKMHQIINSFKITTTEFIILCFICGNDFMPSIYSIQISHKGIEKIIEAYLKTKSKLIENNKINFNTLKKIFIELKYTEKYFMKTTKFETSDKYYKYYTNSNNPDKNKIVKNYIESFEYVYEYYFNECIDNTFMYEYNFVPLLEDIITHYPNEIKLKKNKHQLTPLQQLILIIPPDKFKYVMDEETYEKIKPLLFHIGYMLPTHNMTDTNKYSIEWKQNVLLPPIDYEDFIFHTQHL